MIFVDNGNITDPAINLALEEYLMRNIGLEDDILLFYINEPAIIIGRNQNTLEEINQPYVDAHHIHVVRRLSGGGAVYHDLGNLNFSFISQNKHENVHNFIKFTEPVIRVLQKMGLQAELSGRNDILVDGRKVSGNAQYIAAKRMVSHGTLLFGSDLACVAEALNVKMSKIESKGIKSVRSRVANINEYLSGPMDIAEFRLRLLQGIFDGVEDIPQYKLSDSDWQAARVLSNERYQSWDWNYGQSPEFNVQKTRRFASGEIDARIDVQHGAIKSIKFYGDFFGREDVHILADRLTGRHYTAADLEAALVDIDLSNFFNGIHNEEFINFLYG